MGHPAKKIDIIQQIKQKRGKRKNNLSIVSKPLEAKQRKPEYFAYIITRDAGFAPNPFYGFCTLANCKPIIRRVAKEGDWVIGFYSRAKSVPQNIHHGKLVYAMKVKENITFDKYWNDPRFLKKKSSNKTSKRSCGDNIYHTDSNGNWIQEKNPFHKDKKAQEEDTREDAVLISEIFFYFGKKAVSIPKSIKESINKSWLQKGHKKSIDQSWRGHKFLDEKSGKALIAWLEKKGKGRHGEPIGFNKKNTLRCGTKKSHKDNVSHKSCRTLTKGSC